MKITIISCDICKSDLNIKKDFYLETIFTTEQSEGRAVAPYLSKEKIDICKKCLDKVLEGNYIWGHGAQGRNTFYFKK